MIDAFGAYGYNGIGPPCIPMEKLFNLTFMPLGPFRKTCEISLRLLRQNEDALMTVLETFLHDPTADFIGKKVTTATSKHYFFTETNMCTSSVEPM